MQRNMRVDILVPTPLSGPYIWLGYVTCERSSISGGGGGRGSDMMEDVRRDAIPEMYRTCINVLKWNDVQPDTPDIHSLPPHPLAGRGEPRGRLGDFGLSPRLGAD